MLNANQARIHAFDVVPSLPEPLRPLLDIARNLWWTWHPEAVQLFVRLDPELWRQSHHNPVKMLGHCSQETLDAAAQDDGFITFMQRVLANRDRHLQRVPWLVRKKLLQSQQFTIAYFCAEFGLTECFQIYSGGLGLLAGDHLKSASELGLPLVGVGLLYRNGYFQQYLSSDGWQQEYYPELNFSTLPVEPVKNEQGSQVQVRVRMPGRDVHIALWKTIVGRVSLYLLDTNLPQNDPADRDITSQLYGGDMEMRIKQEIVLGIGGVRALLAIGIDPDVCHMNEGHSAFMALERVGNLIEKHDITFDEARQYAAASHIFTTHTPVPAGIDRFPAEMISRYFRDDVARLRLDMEGLLALGRENVYNKTEFFSMAVLAIRTADWANGVSRLHGEVSRQMWQSIWPGVPETEVPITHVTNGVHARSWISADLNSLLDRYLGARWQDDPSDQTIWQAIKEVPDEELWRVKERRRHSLILWTRRRLRTQMTARGANPALIDALCEALNPDALTIGFARRFATYKRGTLMLRDPKRILKILADARRPVQFLIAGKAHPADGGGKDLIRQIVHFANESQAGHRIVFLENYDIDVARHLVQGCDVWLNTPRRGMEASGTSGMKAALNGVLNCSILDGWWDEACQSDLGWAIGRGESYSNYDQQDDRESRAFYDLLEQQIIPMFYDRDAADMPRQWITRMKNSIAMLAPAFNTNRMVQDYAQKLYLPSLKRASMLKADGLKKSIELAHRKEKLRSAWPKLRIEDVRLHAGDALGVRQPLPVTVRVFLDGLSPDEVRVEAMHGMLDPHGRLCRQGVVVLDHHGDLGQGRHEYHGQVTPQESGKHGFAVRLVPGGEIFRGISEPGLIKWDPAAEAASPQPPREPQAGQLAPARTEG